MYSIFNLDDLIFISKSDRHQIQIVVVENFESSLMLSVWLLWFFWNFTIWQFSWSFLWYLILCVVLCPSRSPARLGSVLARAFGKKSSAWLAMPSKKLGSARHILQKKLGSARLALSFKKLSYLEKQKMSWFLIFLTIS